MLKFDHISFSYPGAITRALDGVSLCLEPGERVVLLGANGSGKSTLAKLANALLLPDAGCVEVDGMSTRADESTRAIRTLVGVVAQDPESQIVSSTVIDEVAFGPENLGLPREEIATRVEAAIKAVGLLGKEDREPHGLSGGEKQRLVIAGILAMQPRYLIFDEPSSMLDANGRSEVRAVIDRLHAEGRGILHITHDVSECVSADRVVVLSHGKIVFEGRPDELLYNEAAFRDKGLVLTPMLALAVRLQRAGVTLPRNLNQPAALAASVVEYVEARGGEV